MRIELIYFDGCPHAEAARANVRAAVAAAGVDATLEEWDRDDPSAPAYVAGYPSPTVLVDGHDVCGDEATTEAASCRAAGAPAVERIVRAMAAH